MFEGAVVYVASFGGSLAPTFDGYGRLVMNKVESAAGHCDLKPFYVKLALTPRPTLCDESYQQFTRLVAEPCDKQAIYGLAGEVAKEDMHLAGDPYVAFVHPCGSIGGR